MNYAVLLKDALEKAGDRFVLNPEERSARYLIALLSHDKENRKQPLTTQPPSWPAALYYDSETSASNWIEIKSARHASEIVNARYTHTNRAADRLARGYDDPSSLRTSYEYGLKLRSALIQRNIEVSDHIDYGLYEADSKQQMFLIKTTFDSDNEIDTNVRISRVASVLSIYKEISNIYLPFGLDRTNLVGMIEMSVSVIKRKDGTIRLEVMFEPTANDATAAA